MATYRIVDMYRKSKAVKGIHYDSYGNPILAYRVDRRHSLFFGLIHYWDYGAYTMCANRLEYILANNPDDFDLDVELSNLHETLRFVEKNLMVAGGTEIMEK